MSNYPDGVTSSDLPETSYSKYDDSEKSDAQKRLERIQVIRYKRVMREGLQKKYRESIKPVH